MIDLARITGFDWDAGNARKNEAHGVSAAEAEQVFFNQPLLLLRDDAHSIIEPRFHALGKTGTAPRANMTCCTYPREFSEQRGRYDSQPSTQGIDARRQKQDRSGRIARSP